MKKISSLWLSGALFLAAEPVAVAQKAPSSPYRTRLAVDGPITVGLGAEPLVWGAAAAVPAAVAYTRMQAGKHSLSDNMVGYAIGATVGVVVPQLHKSGQRAGYSFSPIQGLNVNGYSYGGLVVTKVL